MGKGLLRDISDAVDLAVAVGVRADICTTEVPSRILEVCAAIQVSGPNASEPHDSAVQTESKPTDSACWVSSTMPCGG